MTMIAFFILAVFGNSDGVFPMDANVVEVYGLNQQGRLVYARPQKRRVILQFSASKKSIQASRNEQFEELEEKLQELIEEMKKRGKEGREKFLKEILPRMKEEMEKLREKLRKWRNEEDESEPIKVKAIEILY